MDVKPEDKIKSWDKSQVNDVSNNRGRWRRCRKLKGLNPEKIAKEEIQWRAFF